MSTIIEKAREIINGMADKITLYKARWKRSSPISGGRHHNFRVDGLFSAV
jgi:hypothetical protein